MEPCLRRHPQQNHTKTLKSITDNEGMFLLKLVFSGRSLVELVGQSGHTFVSLRGSKESRRDVKDFHETSWRSLGAKGANFGNFPWQCLRLSELMLFFKMIHRNTAGFGRPYVSIGV